MKAIFYLLVFLFFINATKTGYGQNELKLPYPIIFVHGLVGDDQSWNNVSDFLISQYGLTFGKRMDFCLNADGNNSISVLSSDIEDFTNTNEGNTIIKGDFYTINFDVDNNGILYNNGILSDQSAIVKQGKAVNEAVNHVLQITEKDKVILVGHSMGGLACREFVRTYFNNNVAKLITIGTPHEGSLLADLNVGEFSKLVMDLDMRSEAVRDLSPTSTFLYGGKENSIENLLRYRNVDVDCNGETNNYITGLNNDDYNLDFVAKTFIVSKYGILNGDGVVKLKSQYIDSSDTIMTDRPHITLGENKPGEAKDIHSIIRGIDEPDNPDFAFKLNYGRSILGFITYQIKNQSEDVDLFKIELQMAGNLNIDLYADSPTGVKEIDLLDQNLKLLKQVQGINQTIDEILTGNLPIVIAGAGIIKEYLESGVYFIRVKGKAELNTYQNPYTLVTDFNVAPKTSMSVSTNKLKFYDCLIGTPKENVITVTNTGETDFFVTGLGLSETDADQFEITNTLPFKISSKASQSITVRFNPTGNGTKTAKLTINTDLAAIPPKIVTLEGNGTDHETRVLVFDPTVNYNFGDAKLTKSKSKSVTIQNTGSNAVTISNIVISGSNPEFFTFSNSPNIPFDIGSGVTKTVNVQFSPTSLGFKDASVDLNNNSDNVSPSYSIGFTGNGIENYSGTYVSGTISTDETWTLAGSPYIITSSVTVNTGVVLTVEPGVIVKFNSGQSMYVNGTLNATETTFTSNNVNPVAGDWGNIQVGVWYNSEPANVILNSCKMYFASNLYVDKGRATLINTDLINFLYHGVQVESNGTLNMSGGKIVTESEQAKSYGSGVFANTGAHSSLSGVNIQNFQNGIQLFSDSKTSISDINITNCGYPLVYNGSADLSVKGINSFTGNSNNLALINFNNVSDILTLPRIDIPYYFNQGMQVTSSGQLFISSNNILKFADGTSLTINGIIVARPEENESIYFTSIKDDNWGGDTNKDGSATAPMPGTWYGIRFEDISDDANCNLNNCKIRFAGAGNTGGISMFNASPTIEETELTSNYIGIYMQYASSPVLKSNTIGSCQMMPIALSFEANPVMTDNVFSFSDNAYDAIGLIGGTLTANADLRVMSVTNFPNITYFLLDQVNIPVGMNLTIEKGVTIKTYTDNNYWYPRRIVVDGSLIADGSIDSMITFTSLRDDSFGYPGDTNKDGTITSPVVGDWGGIIFNPGSTGLLNNCRIKYASIVNFPFMNCSQTENLISSGIALIDASPTITNCEFKDLNYGVTCYRVSNPELLNNKMMNISGTPVAISASSNPSIAGNTYINVGWRAIGLLGGNVCQDGIIKKRNEGGFTNISYVLISDMTINQEVSVSVEEGVVIKVNGSNIYVDGGFKTNGSQGKSVIFTSLQDDNEGNPLDTNGDGNATTPASGNWGSIKFRSSSNDEFCKLINTNLKYGGGTNEGGVTFENSSAQITDVVITNTSNYGVYCNGNSAPLINNTTIQNCSLDPFAMSLTSNPSFSNITFLSNKSKAIKIIEGTLSSDAVLASRNIAGITNIAYIINQLTISENAKLTINPGVVIKFRGDPNYPSYTFIKVLGTLISNGTSSNKIYFTSYADDSRGGDSNNDGNSSSPNKGDWGAGYVGCGWWECYWSENPGGIIFMNNNTNSDNLLRQCEILYAGTGLRFKNSYAKIDECTIQLANYHGVSIVGSANPEIRNCQFNNINFSPVLLSMFSNPIFENCSAQNVGFMALAVIPETYSQSASIPLRNFGGFENISYLLISPCTVNSGTTITIPKGVIFKSTSGITITEPQVTSSWASDAIAKGFVINGRLNIQGTNDEPVIFTNAADDRFGNPKDMNQDGSASTPPPIAYYRDYWGNYNIYWTGDWLTFNDVSDDLSSLNNVVFEYGNNAITTLSSSPIIDNVVFENLICGVNLYGVSEPKIDNCIFNNLQYYPVQISLVSYPASSTNNVISGSTYKVIKVRDETLTQDVTLPKRNFGGISNIPYYFNNYTIGTSASLTIEPGIVCKFESFNKYNDSYPNINIFKSLNANGGSSPDSNIVFTSIKDDFYGGDSNSDKSATSPSSGDWGGLKFENESLDPLCKFKNCIFRFAEKSIHTNSSSPSFENCNITINNYGVYATAASNPVFKDCDFSNNYHFAINNVDKSFEIDARNCWWGNNLGPIQSNSSRYGAGTQEFVTDAVNYTPWKTMGAGNPLTGDVSLNGIVQAYDASLILKYVVGSLTLNNLQKMAADVSGEAGVSAFDASLILQYVVGTRQSFPAELKKAVLTENINSQLIVGNAAANIDQEIHIPLTVLKVSGLQATEIKIQYDPLNIRCNRVIQIVSRMNMVFRNDSINGIITIAMAGINPLKSDTILAEIVFQSISSSIDEIKNDLIVNRFIANETDLTAQAINGSIVIYNNSTEALYTTEGKAGLISVFPNPSSGNTFVEYQLNNDNHKVLIELYNLMGQKVKILVEKAQIRGKYLLDITEYCSSLESGSYFIRMTHEGISQSKKFLIVK